MRPAFLCLALGGALLSAVSAQWLEAELRVPDTLDRMLAPECFVYDAADNTIYVGGNSCVIAIDGETNEKIARVATGTHVADLCYNPQNNKVYSANVGSDDVTVIDCATNAVITTLSVGEAPVALCYSTQDNKIYCANDSSCDVDVIDGSADTIVTTIGVDGRAGSLCYNPLDNKIYCADRFGDDVNVIDGTTDSVIATVAVDSSENAVLCYNPRDNKIYCASDQSGNVVVIDGSTDSVITAVAAGYHPRALCYNPQDNKVYCAGAPLSSVTVIDGATDSIVATVPMNDDPIALCYNQQNDKVYCASYGGGNVKVIDGVTDFVVGTVEVGSSPRSLCYNPQDNKVYCAVSQFDIGGGSVRVICGETDSIVTNVTTGDRPRALSYNPQDNKVYCANYESGSVTIVDGATSSIISTVAVGAKTQALCYNQQSNEVYCGNGGCNFVTVIDGATDRVDDTIWIGYANDLLCYNSQNNKVYSHAGRTIAIIDGATHQTLTALVVGQFISAVLYVPRNNAVYCAKPGSISNPLGEVIVIDGAGDSIIVTIDSTGTSAALCYNPLNNRVYCGSGVVIDAATNTVLDTVPGGGGQDVCFNIQNSKLYFAMPSGEAVHVVAARSDSLVAVVPAGTWPWALFYNPVNNKVYCANRQSDDLTVIAGANDKVRKSLAVGVSPRALEWNPIQNRMYVANDSSATISILRDYIGPPLGDLDVDNDSLGVAADTIRLEGRGQYAVGEFVLANTNVLYNPDPADGPSQSPVDTFNVAGSLLGPGGTLDSIFVSTLPESLMPGQAIVCTLSVYVPPGLDDSVFVGRITITGRDTAGIGIAEAFYALIPSRLGDLDIDDDSLDVVADTVRLRKWTAASSLSFRRSDEVAIEGISTEGPLNSATSVSLGVTAGVQLECVLGEFILANTSESYNPDTADGPSLSCVDSLQFTASLAGPGGTIDSVLALNLPESLAQGRTAVCTLAVYVPDSMPVGDYAGPIVITGLDSVRYLVADTVYALVTKEAAPEQLGDLDIDSDSLDVVHDTMNVRVQPGGSPSGKARFMLVNTSSTYNPDAEDGPSRSPLSEIRFETGIEGHSGAIDSVRVLNLPESLAVGQAVECTLALFVPAGESLGTCTGQVTICGFDTLGYTVRDSFVIVASDSEPAQGPDSFCVAPIPFKPHQNPEHDAIHFQGLSAGARVTVYDASGQTVWSATETVEGHGEGHVAWDAKVASGIYVYLVVAGDGTSRVGKLSVIR